MRINKLPEGDWALVRVSGAALRLTPSEREELYLLLKEERNQKSADKDEELYCENY